MSSLLFEHMKIFEKFSPETLTLVACALATDPEMESLREHLRLSILGENYLEELSGIDDSSKAAPEEPQTPRGDEPDWLSRYQETLDKDLLPEEFPPQLRSTPLGEGWYTFPLKPGVEVHPTNGKIRYRNDEGEIFSLKPTIRSSGRGNAAVRNTRRYRGGRFLAVLALMYPDYPEVCYGVFRNNNPMHVAYLDKGDEKDSRLHLAKHNLVHDY